MSKIKSTLIAFSFLALTLGLTSIAHAQTTVALTSGVPYNGSLPERGDPQNEVFDVDATQYTIDIPQGASKLEVDLIGNPNTVDIDLFVRFGQRITQCSTSCPPPIPFAYDYSSNGATGTESIIIAPSSYQPLQAGTYYIGIANAHAATFTLTARAITGVIPPGNFIISEFRLRGTNGASDEFVELYNNSDSPITVSTSDASAGWAVAAVSSFNNRSTLFTIPNGTVIPARGHYLGVNSSGYSLGNYPAGNGGATATGNATYTTNIADSNGLAVFKTALPANFVSANRLDAVGHDSKNGSLSAEGAVLTPSAGITTNGEYSYVRKFDAQTTLPVDTDNNAADFVLVSTTGGTFNGVVSILGAPGPENLSSPVANNKIAISLVDPLTSRLSGANFVRNGSGNSGTLTLRRHFTNNTGATVTRLRFRLIDITTLNTPVLAPPQADLRLTDSTDETVSTNLGPVTVKGTQLEQPPVQALGGGLNTSATIALPAGGLVNGGELDVQFLMNVIMNGRFRFFLNVEALP